MTHKQSTFLNASELTVFVNGVYAHGELLCTEVATLADGMYFILEDGANPAVTFYYDVSGTYVPGGGYDATHIQLNVSADVTDEDVAATTDTAINAIGAGLAITSANTPGQARVLLTNDAKGVAGNINIVRGGLPDAFKTYGMLGGVNAGPAQADILDILTKDGRWVLFYEN